MKHSAVTHLKVREVLLHIFSKIPDSLCTYVTMGFHTSLVASDNLDVTNLSLQKKTILAILKHNTSKFL